MALTTEQLNVVNQARGSLGAGAIAQGQLATSGLPSTPQPQVRQTTLTPGQNQVVNQARGSIGLSPVGIGQAADSGVDAQFNPSQGFNGTVPSGTITGATTEPTTAQDLQSRVDDFFAQQTQLQGQLAAARQLSPEQVRLQERASNLQQQLRDIEQSTLRSELGVEGQGRGITLGTIEGQQGKLRRESALQQMGVSSQLQAINDQIRIQASMQQANMQGIADQLGFSQDNLDNFMRLTEFIADQNDTPEEVQTAARQSAIVSAISQGVMDPFQIFETVNFDEQGNQVNDITLEEIQGALNFIQTGDEIGALDQAKLDLERRKLGLQERKFGFEQEQAVAGVEGDVGSGSAKTKSLLDATNALLNEPGFIDKLSGASGLGPGLTQEGRDAKAAFDRITGLLTVDNLDLMSGVLTDKDIEILQNAATSLRRGTSREAMVAELNRIRDAAASEVAGATPLASQATSFGFTPDEQNQIDFLLLSPLSTPATNYSQFFQ